MTYSYNPTRGTPVRYSTERAFFTDDQAWTSVMQMTEPKQGRASHNLMLVHCHEHIWLLTKNSCYSLSFATEISEFFRSSLGKGDYGKWSTSAVIWSYCNCLRDFTVLPAQQLVYRKPRNCRCQSTAVQRNDLQTQFSSSNCGGSVT